MLFSLLHVYIVHTMLLRFTSCALHGPPFGIQDQSPKKKSKLPTTQSRSINLHEMPVKLLEDGNQRLHHGTLQDGASTRAIWCGEARSATSTVTPPRVRNCCGGSA